jgi:hypothetical protein
MELMRQPPIVLILMRLGLPYHMDAAIDRTYSTVAVLWTIAITEP